jgi:hypothetical protein
LPAISHGLAGEAVPAQKLARAERLGHSIAQIPIHRRQPPQRRPTELPATERLSPAAPVQRTGPGADSGAPALPSVAATTVQRYLIVGADDFTRWHKENPGSDVDPVITQIAMEMIKELDASNPEELQMQTDIRADAGGLLRKQLNKWIVHKVGDKAVSRNALFGRKNQSRAYANYKDLAYALLGWVKAKPGRRAEKALAGQVQSTDAISYHLDSILLKIGLWIGGQPKGLEISNDLTGIAQIGGHDWNIYQNYFNNVAGLGVNTALPVSYIDVLQNPQNYDVRKKTGMLHDIMHYFLEKYSVDNTIGLVGNVPAMNATVHDPVTGGTKREAYNRPENTQIRDNQKDLQGLVKPENMPGGSGPSIKVSGEEAHPSFRQARSRELPMYGRHSFTAARMMLMVQNSGGTPTEISAMAWSIMSYWRLNYDHRSIPYHTLHEIMDFLPEFGGAYDVTNPHVGINLFTQDGLIQSLRDSILASPQKRNIDKLIATDTPAHNAAWFLANPALWAQSDVMNFLSTTNLPDPDFLSLNRAHLHQFFSFSPQTQHIKTLIPQNRRNYVDGV